MFGDKSLAVESRLTLALLSSCLREDRCVPTHPPEHSSKLTIYCDFNTTVNVLLLFSVFFYMRLIGGLTNLKISHHPQNTVAGTNFNEPHCDPSPLHHSLRETLTLSSVSPS